MIEQIKKIAVNAVKLSGAMLKREYESFNRREVMLKSNHEILTKADLLSQEIIIKEIKKYFPAHEIVSEEKANEKKSFGYVWYIDPIDGTTNFSCIIHYGQFL